MKSPKYILISVLATLLVVGVYHSFKPLPQDVSYESEVYQIDPSHIHFFKDLTYLDKSGERVSDQQIFDEVFRMIDEAERYVLIDFFFFSDFIGVETSAYRYLADELTTKLVAKKESNPDIAIQVITDPINVMYGGHRAEHIERLRAAGVPVVITDLRPLRDSNPLYSSVWRTFIQWFGVSDEGGYLPNLLDEKSPDLGLRAYLKTPNYKANHRKVVLTDYVAADTWGFSTLVTSANPHDGSSAHSNVALRIDDALYSDVIKTERAVAEFSNQNFLVPNARMIAAARTADEGSVGIQFLTEGKMKARVLVEIDPLVSGDELDIAMFYIADRDVVRAIKRASQRGVTVRMLLDPNKDAFGREKNGMPNRQVAHELLKNENVTVRWCNTHGEQCHAKLLIARSGEETTIMLGSTNYTKRNMADLNLESNVAMTGPSDTSVFGEIETFFTEQWNNENGREYSVAYEVYADNSFIKTVFYRLEEFIGLSRW